MLERAERVTKLRVIPAREDLNHNASKGTEAQFIPVDTWSIYMYDRPARERSPK